VMTLGDSGPRVLSTPSRDLGRVMSCLAAIRPGGAPHVAPAVHIAQLALKHRQNKNQRQRIVLFVASPVAAADAKGLAKLGKALRKNNVSLDVVSFGQVDENSECLGQLVEAAGQAGDESVARRARFFLDFFFLKKHPLQAYISVTCPRYPSLC
jgi:26S proteasome regulatory subunit N10